MGFHVLLHSGWLSPRETRLPSPRPWCHLGEQHPAEPSQTLSAQSEGWLVVSSVVFMLQRAVGDLFVRSVAHFPAHLATLGSKGALTGNGRESPLLCPCHDEDERGVHAYGQEHRERGGELSPHLVRETALIGKQMVQRSRRRRHGGARARSGKN